MLCLDAKLSLLLLALALWRICCVTHLCLPPQLSVYPENRPCCCSLCNLVSISLLIIAACCFCINFSQEWDSVCVSIAARRVKNKDARQARSRSGSLQVPQREAIHGTKTHFYTLNFLLWKAWRRFHSCRPDVCPYSFNGSFSFIWKHKSFSKSWSNFCQNTKPNMGNEDKGMHRFKNFFCNVVNIKMNMNHLILITVAKNIGIHSLTSGSFCVCLKYFSKLIRKQIILL